MRVTRYVRSETIDGGIMYAFYDDKTFCSAFYEEDLSTEWQQIIFLLDILKRRDNFEGIEWTAGSKVIVAGLSKHELLDLDCKLCNYQFSKRLPIERQLGVEIHVDLGDGVSYTLNNHSADIN